LYGGAGLDSFWADTGDGIGDASAVEAAARSIHKVDQFYQPWTNNASSGDYVSLEIAGQNLRDPATTSAASGGYRNFANVKPLFVDGAQYDDIAQGSIGDCYYLASLASVADSDPDFVEQMIAPLGDGTFAVRFYRSGKEVYLRLDGDLPVRSTGSLAYAGFGNDGELWVPLMEKAYAFFRYEKNSYESIHGGWMGTVYEEMTNLPSGFKMTNESADSVWRFMSRALAGGHAVSAGSYYNASGPIVGSHAYSVRSIEQTDEGRFVTVYNPWGVDGRSYDANYSDGMIRLNMYQFQEYFIAVVTCAA
ncbi:MAG: C2 family cysteine protease, partial [Planctomycetota bacterium]